MTLQPVKSQQEITMFGISTSQSARNIAGYNLDTKPLFDPIVPGMFLHEIAPKIYDRFHALRFMRDQAIASIAVDNGMSPCDGFPAMAFDSTAPLSTNLQMLEYAGVTGIDPSEAVEDMSDERLETMVNYLIDCLASLRVFLENTADLDDTNLYLALMRVVQEEVPLLPPSQGVAEYVKLTPSSSLGIGGRDRSLPTKEQVENLQLYTV
jgi:hypothetical protein